MRWFALGLGGAVGRGTRRAPVRSFVLGMWLGTLVSVVGTTTASLTIFLLCRATSLRGYAEEHVFATFTFAAGLQVRASPPNRIDIDRNDGPTRSIGTTARIDRSIDRNDGPTRSIGTTSRRVASRRVRRDRNDHRMIIASFLRDERNRRAAAACPPFPFFQIRFRVWFRAPVRRVASVSLSLDRWAASS